jgi:hypothetical protein
MYHLVRHIKYLHCIQTLRFAWRPQTFSLAHDWSVVCCGAIGVHFEVRTEFLWAVTINCKLKIVTRVCPRCLSKALPLASSYCCFCRRKAGVAARNTRSCRKWQLGCGHRCQGDAVTACPNSRMAADSMSSYSVKQWHTLATSSEFRSTFLLSLKEFRFARWLQIQKL